MGKSKPRDRRRNRPDPTSRPVKPPADPELAAIREQRILPVLKDLTSADLKTRSSAATAISNIIEDTKCRKLLLREQIVKILLEQTLTDSSFETRTAGWGILRNLALEEEADFCIHLYRQDVLTAIDGSVKTVSGSSERVYVCALILSYLDYPNNRISRNPLRPAPQATADSVMESYEFPNKPARLPRRGARRDPRNHIQNIYDPKLPIRPAFIRFNTE